MATTFPVESGSISRAPTQLENTSNAGFRVLAHLAAWLTVLLVLYIVFKIGSAALPAMHDYGLHFLTTTTWDANTDQYGILPQIWGTLYSSVLAVVIGGTLGIAVAVFLSERFLSSFVFRVLKKFGVENHPFWSRIPNQLDALLKNLVELLAAIPSVVYGLWGIFVVIPMIRPYCNWLHEHLADLPLIGRLFGTALSGPGMLPAAIVLAIMILPTISAISRDALAAVPSKLRDAAYGLGATRWEAILAVILPTARTGIWGAILLAFGRALGETMALAMLVGNANVISVSLFSPGNTLAALLANSFAEANTKQVSVLMYAALVLMGITLLVNMLGALILQRATRDMKGAR